MTGWPTWALTIAWVLALATMIAFAVWSIATT
jgi:hypothetical protein